MTSRTDTLPGARPPASVPLRNWALAAIALVALALAFADSLRAGMPNGDLQQHWRFRIYAFPIVLSQLYYGRPYDYVGYKRLEMAFEPNGVVLEEAAPSLTSIAKVEANGPFLILADDKGIVDFVRLAFTFFGIRTDGLFYTYFAILFVSALCFLIAYFNDRAKLALLAMYFVALLAIMPVFAGFPATVNILDLHTFGILSLTAVLHVLLAATDPDPVRPRVLIPTLVQVLIIVLSYHIRASSVSQTLAAAVAYPAIVYFSTPAGPAESRRRWRDAFTVRRFVPLGLLLVAVGSLPIYQRVMYHRDYFGPRATLQHIVYHNLLIGLGWSPVLRDRYDLGALGDLGAANAIDTFLARTPRAAAGRSRHWAAEGMNTVTTQLAFDWASYEDAGKALYFTIWREQPLECLKVYLYYHPVDIVKVFTAATVKARPGFAYNPFRPHLLLLFVVTAMLSLGGTTFVRPVYGLIPLVMLAAALLVPLVVYAGGFIIVADAFVLVGLLIYTTLWGALAWAGNHVPGAARSVTSQTV